MRRYKRLLAASEEPVEPGPRTQMLQSLSHPLAKEPGSAAIAGEVRRVLPDTPVARTPILGVRGLLALLQRGRYLAGNQSPWVADAVRAGAHAGERCEIRIGDNGIHIGRAVPEHEGRRESRPARRHSVEGATPVRGAPDGC